MPVLPTQGESYGRTVLDIILDTFRNSTYASKFNDFIYGNPEEEIETDRCPCVIGIKESTSVEQETTAHDRISYKLLIRIIIDKYKISSPYTATDVMTFRELENMIEGFDPVTGLYDPQSIFYLLRENFTQNGYIVDQRLQANYGKVINPFIDEATREAQISIMCDKLVLVANRT